MGGQCFKFNPRACDFVPMHTREHCVMAGNSCLSYGPPSTPYLSLQAHDWYPHYDSSVQSMCCPYLVSSSRIKAPRFRRGDSFQSLVDAQNHTIGILTGLLERARGEDAALTYLKNDIDKRLACLARKLPSSVEASLDKRLAPRLESMQAQLRSELAENMNRKEVLECDKGLKTGKNVNDASTSHPFSYVHPVRPDPWKIAFPDMDDDEMIALMAPDSDSPISPCSTPRRLASRAPASDREGLQCCEFSGSNFHYSATASPNALSNTCNSSQHSGEPHAKGVAEP